MHHVEVNTVNKIIAYGEYNNEHNTYVYRNIPYDQVYLEPEFIQICIARSCHKIIEYIPNPSDEVIKAALDKSYRATKYLRRDQIDLIHYALSKSAKALRYIEEPDENMYMSAVSLIEKFSEHDGMSNNKLKLLTNIYNTTPFDAVKIFIKLRFGHNIRKNNLPYFQ